MITRKWMGLGVLLLGTAVAGYTWSQQAGERIMIQQPLTEDAYLAAQEVEVRAAVDGDLVVAGRLITVSGEVAEDVIAAGQTVKLQGAVLDDVRAVGRDVTIGGDVSGHAVAAGQNVVLESGVSVGDWVAFAGQRLDVLGDVGGDARLAGETVVIGGVIGGDVDVLAERIRIEPGAAIRGNLTWRGETEPEIAEDALIEGQVVQLPGIAPEPEASPFWSALLIVVAEMLAVIALYLVFPAFARQTVASIRAQPWIGLASGVVFLGAVPVVTVVLFVTGVGFLLAIMLLLLYLLGLLVGWLIGLVLLADIGMRFLQQPALPATRISVLSLVLATVAIALLAQLPWLGGLLWLALWLFGLGALQLGLYQRYRAAT